MEGKSKLTPDELKGCLKDDCQFIIRDNEILVGLMDKNQVGAGSEYGLMHAIHELYGPEVLGCMFTALSKLFSMYLQSHGFTCGLDDL